MDMFTQARFLGAAAARQKLALEAADPDEMTFIQKHPGLAGMVGGAVGRGIGSGLIGSAAAGALGGLKTTASGAYESPNTAAVLQAIQNHSGRLGTGLGTAAGHYLATKDYDGGVGRSLAAGTIAGTLAGDGGRVLGNGNIGVLSSGIAGGIGSSLVGAPDPERVYAQRMAAQGR